MFVHQEGTNDCIECWIELDKINGIDLDTIVEATRVINPILDKYDLIDQEYTLEITSKERGEE